MSIFHGTVSRRDFMKNLGLAGAGIGAAALVAPTFHDLDELAASSGAAPKRPWYVKERPLLNPTTEIDQSLLKRYDRRYQSQTTLCKSYYTETWARRDAAAAKGKAISDARTFETPGYTLRSRVMSSAALMRLDWAKSWTGPKATTTGTYSPSKTPSDLGTTKWTGTPEEASKMMNAALRYYGASHTGYAEFDDFWQGKMLTAYTTKGATAEYKGGTYESNLPTEKNSLKYTVENVPAPVDLESTEGKMVIPSSFRSVIWASPPVARQFLKTPNASKGYYTTSFPGPNGTGGTLSDFIYGGLHRFVRSLGYQSCSNTGHQTEIFNVNGAGVMVGGEESSRQQNYGLTPEFGPAQYPTTFVTDLELAPTNPIDAGMWKFCQTCGFCAINCPAGCIETAKGSNVATYEPPNFEGKARTFHNLGPKMLWNNYVRCQEYRSEASGCSQCWGYCTFSIDSAAMVHALVKQTISQTSLFNSFFATMGEKFGYGAMDNPEDWWDMNLPVMGIDTAGTATKGR
ncbi:reductive dehalogenase [Dehalogenimonas formicexedens]|uniref:Reductive dehalogenase n=1 Tax=Dehalogenimonas formicexedens TaxID=1839801 RepID=A0A1P8F669_9CHLR|nr:reductive dehalogenase [Dehalogenimonas formicexedens]APV43963.1 reductive dehalogenase [Dehalogenimonas formicexedens]